MDIDEAKKALDKVIDKARVHFYKPIQVAEILYRDRINKDIVLTNLSTYRTTSRKWRDMICLEFLGRTSSSSARYQDETASGGI
ncbi:MAG: HaeII family restriction endonuclease [Calothrix sp. MO_192.B10]|nr:HaeII family restriction endonuclease [Calothrix sp. MO_192.B10]